MSADFIPLTLRSSYSLLESMLKPQKIIDLLTQNKICAASVADHNNMFGALEFSELMIGAGIKPIMGLSLDVITEASNPHLMRFYAQDMQGYQNLMTLASRAWLDSPDGDAKLDLSVVTANSDGLICLTGGEYGKLYDDLSKRKWDTARQELESLRDVFTNRLYVEISRHGAPEEQIAEPEALNLAYDLGLPIVATHDVRFAKPRDAHAHDALMCIANSSFLGQEDRPRVQPSQHFLTPTEMTIRFADLPEAVEATMEIAQRCSYRSEKRAPILPRFSDTQEGEDAALAALAKTGLENRLNTHPKFAELSVYESRLEHELNIISKMGFPGYFLIVADFIQWAKDQNIPVGPGRGSGAGSLVAWSLQITDLDPLHFDLLFERFLNPERVSMPDFDIDFCQERRGEVIRYVRDKYGEDSTASIITFGSLQAKAVVRDVGRVMEMPYGQVDRIAKLIPFNPANPPKLSEAIAGEPKFAEEKEKDARVGELLNVALDLEGLYRNAGTHAAGVVIGDRPLTELVPIYRDPRADLPATQFSMYWVEQAGLVKFDFLGLKTLTVIDRALNMAKSRGAEPSTKWKSLDCEDTFALLASGESFGVFQLEGQGMRDTLRRARPNNIEDIIAIISLYRPGPMDNIPTYIAGKDDPNTVQYDHPDLKPILEPTYGVPVYQEQVMRMAQEIAGYSLGEADLLRRAMGKKKQSEMDKQRDRFVSGAADLKAIDETLANTIFDTMAKFAGYGFNKSHAAAYAVIGYQTGYLKCHFPAEFVAASMSLDIQNTDKLGAFFQEAKRLGIPVLAPCINTSEADFTVKDGKIHYALGAVKGVGFEAMRLMVRDRQTNGPFKDLDDFAARIDPRHVNKKALEQLARAGALDCLNANRASVLGGVPIILGAAQQAVQDRQGGQSGLFGDAEEALKLDLPKAATWGNQQILAQELKAIGFYCSGHPLDDVLKGLDRSRFCLTNEINERAVDGQPLELIGIVTGISERPARNDGKLGFVKLSDPAGELEIIAYPEDWADNRDRITNGKSVYVKLGVRKQDDEVRLNLLSAHPLESTTLGQIDKSLQITVSTNADHNSFRALAQLLEQKKISDGGQIYVSARLKDGRTALINLAGNYDISQLTQQMIRNSNGIQSVTTLDDTKISTGA